MNKKITILLLALLLVSSITSVLAFMPPTHTYIADQSLAQASDSEIGKLVMANYNDYIGCNILADISVFYYFSDGFSKIGTKYKATHSTSLCQRMVLSAINDREKACAYGLCSHLTSDGVAHNIFVPETVRKTGLVNGLIHIFAEEKVNDELLAREGMILDTKTKQALSDIAPIHKEFFRKNLLAVGSDFPFDSMYDSFVAEVTAESKYSVGFRSFTAVPMEVHLIFSLAFILSLVGMAFLIKKKKKNIFNKIAIVFMFLTALLVVFVYTLFFMGKLWMFFQWASYPISSMMPVSGWEAHINSAVRETTNLLNQGTNYVMAMTPDPAGEIALETASQVGATMRTIIMVVLSGLIGLFIWLNIKKRKRNEN